MKKQEHRYLDCYVSKQFGLVLMRKDVHVDVKCQGVAFWLKSMGLDQANEKTFSLAAAIASYIEPFEVDHILKVNRNIKTYFDALPPQVVWPFEYPESVVEFENMHIGLYINCFADSKPGPPLWSPQQRRMLWELVPCRNTHTGCEQVSPINVRPSSMPHTVARSSSIPMLQTTPSEEVHNTYGGGTHIGENGGMQFSQPPRRPQQLSLRYDPTQVPEQAVRQPLQPPMRLDGGVEYFSPDATAQPDSRAASPEPLSNASPERVGVAGTQLAIISPPKLAPKGGHRCPKSQQIYKHSRQIIPVQ